MEPCSWHSALGREVGQSPCLSSRSRLLGGRKGTFWPCGVSVAGSRTPLLGWEGLGTPPENMVGGWDWPLGPPEAWGSGCRGGRWVTGSWGPPEPSPCPQSLQLPSPPTPPLFLFSSLSLNYFLGRLELWNLPGVVLLPSYFFPLKVFSRCLVRLLPLLPEVSLPFSLHLLSCPMSPVSSSTRK